MKKKFSFALGAFTMCIGGSVFAQVKTEKLPAEKVEKVQVARQQSVTPSPQGAASAAQTSGAVSAQPANASGSTRAQMPSVNVGGTQTYNGGAKAQPNRSSGVPSDKGRIVPREKLIDAK